VTVEQSALGDVVVEERPTSVVALTRDAASLVSSVLGREVEPAETVAEGTDLVVTTPEKVPRQSGPTYVAPVGSINEVERALTDLGLLLGRAIEARRLVEEIETKRSMVRERLQGAKPVRVFVDTGFFSTVSDESLVGRLIEEAGGDNIAGPGVQSGPFDVNRLAQLDPEVYFATEDSGTTLDDLRRDRRTRNLKAVKTGRFAQLASKVLEPGGAIGTELVAIARYLHPDAFR
jgi:ABC-type Fe3+-hydroxamate transport system substrate-binding protein